MNILKYNKCEACNINAPEVTETELKMYLKELPDWHLEIKDSVKKIFRVYSFNDYKSALIFTNSVAEIAEDEGHHPAILLEWGKVKVKWWTHKINGLHKNDFIMASKTDKIYDIKKQQ